jgi:hypothetical protein
VVEEIEVVALHARAVQVDERRGEGAQIGGQSGEKGLGVEHQLVDVADARGERQADTALEIGADRALAVIEGPRPLRIEAHVMDGRAAAPYVTHHPEGRRELGSKGGMIAQSRRLFSR